MLNVRAAIIVQVEQWRAKGRILEEAKFADPAGTIQRALPHFPGSARIDKTELHIRKCVASPIFPQNPQPKSTGPILVRCALADAVLGVGLWRETLDK